MDSLGSIFADPTAYADPVAWHATAKQIRDTSPILKVTVAGYPEFWALTTHADVMEIERHPDLFTNAPVPTLVPEPRLDDMANSPVKTLIQMDGDEHKAHRNIVNDWFKPGNVKSCRTASTRWPRTSVDRMATMGDRCDFANDVAVVLPAAGDPVHPRPARGRLPADAAAHPGAVRRRGPRHRRGWCEDETQCSASCSTS